MRDFKGMKRQRGRNRGGGSSSGGGGKQPQNANRAFDSNGPEGVKVRGNAQHVFEKYQQLARDANAAGDRVLGENYLQHAEHYFRLLRAMQPTRPASEILGRDHFSSGFDIDFEDEGVRAQAEAADEAAAAASANGEVPQEAQESDNREQPRWQGQDGGGRRDERPRDDRNRDDRPRGDRFEAQGQGGQGQGGQGRRDRWRERDDRPRDGARDDRPRTDDRPRADDRPRDRDDRPRAERDDRPRDERPRDDRPRDERPRDERPRYDREERRERDPLAVVEPQAQGSFNDERPAAPVLRDAEGGRSQAPAFLQPRAAPAEPRPEAAAGDEAERRPRRRRAPRSFDAGEGAPPSNEAEEA